MKFSSFYVVLNSKMTTEQEVIFTYGRITRKDNLRIIDFNGVLVGSNGKIGVMGATDTPSNQTRYIPAFIISAGKYYCGYITISYANGDIFAYYYTPSGTGAAAGSGTSVYLNGTYTV